MLARCGVYVKSYRLDPGSRRERFARLTLVQIYIPASEGPQTVEDGSDYAWYPRPQLYPADQLAPPKYPSPYAQLNDTLLGQVITESVYMNP
jgi:hypothetical protein